MPPTQSFESPLDEPLRRHLRSLESIFSDPELRRLRSTSPQHPAAIQFTEITDYLDRGLPYPDDVEIARSVTSALLDRSVWISPVSDDPWEMLSDEEAKRQVRNRVPQPEQYNDVMAEVFVWSWLAGQGQLAELVEQEGMPDIRLTAVDQHPVWFEIKRIRLGTGLSRVRKDIRKANRQIRTADGSTAGVVVISLERAAQRATLDDEVPGDVAPYITEALRETKSGLSRNVAKVLLTWDELVIDPEVGARVSYTMRRRGVLLTHPDPVSDVWLKDSHLDVNMTAQLSGPWPQGLESLTGEGLRLSHGDFVVGPGFREFNAGTDGIRPQHALEAAASPSAEYRRIADDVSSARCIMTRRVVASKTPYTLILMVHDLEDGRREIGDAYRLYDDEGGRLSRDALAAFKTFVNLYGVPVGLQIDAERMIWAKLFLTARINTASSEIGLALPSDGGHYLTGATTIVRNKEPLGFSVAFAYAVDVNRYKDDVARRSRGFGTSTA